MSKESKLMITNIFKGVRTVDIFCIGLIFLNKIVTFLAFPNPVRHPDSDTYALKNGWDFSKISFTGHSDRSWPVPLFLSIFPSDVLREFGQLLLSFICWAILIRSIDSITNFSRIYQNIIKISITLIAVSSSINQWDTTILGTNLMLNSSILCIAFFIKLVHSDVSLRFRSIVLVLILALIFYQKSSNFILTIFGFILMIFIIKKRVSKRWILALFLVFSIFFAHGLYVAGNVNKNWKSGYLATTLLWQLGAQSPTATSFANFLKQTPHVPSCIYKEAPFVDISTSINKIANSCPSSQTYLKSLFPKDFFNFLISSPISVVKLTSLGFGASFTNSSYHYGNSVSLLPDVFDRLFFGSMNPDFRISGIDNQESANLVLSKGEPLWLFLPGLGIVTAFLLFFAYSFFFRNIRNQIYFACLTFIFMIQLELNFLLLPSEWVRQSTPFSAPILLLGAIYVVNFINFRSRRSS